MDSNSDHFDNGDFDLDFQEDEIEYAPEKADLEGNILGSYNEVLQRFINFGSGGGGRAEVLERFISAGNTSNTQKTEAITKDQKLHAHLRSRRNTVPVPDHWGEEEEDLQGKRGVKKRSYELPDFISATGIENIRQAHVEKERDAGKPVMGMMDIGYSVLHDAFFKYQTKPKLSTYGELYNEGGEFEAKTKKHKPSMLSEEIETDAFSMSEGAHCSPDVSMLQSHELKDGENTLSMKKHWGELEEEEELGDGLEAIDEVLSLPETLERALYQEPEEIVDLFQVDKSDKEDGEDVSLTPEDLKDLNNIVDVLAAKYEAKEESKDVSKRIK